MGVQEWIKYEEERWRCPQCGLPMRWYDAICAGCGGAKIRALVSSAGRIVMGDASPKVHRDEKRAPFPVNPRLEYKPFRCVAYSSEYFCELLLAMSESVSAGLVLISRICLTRPTQKYQSADSKSYNCRSKERAAVQTERKAT